MATMANPEETLIPRKLAMFFETASEKRSRIVHERATNDHSIGILGFSTRRRHVHLICWQDMGGRGLPQQTGLTQSHEAA